MLRKTILLGVIFILSATGLVHAADSPPADRDQPFQGAAACAGITAQTLSTPECDGFMAARPAPAASRVPVDLGIVDGLSFMRFTKDKVVLYSAPGGRRVGVMTTGFTYVVPSEIQGDWIKIRRKYWVQRADVAFTRPSEFSGIFLNGGLDIPIAWVLWQHYASPAPATSSQKGDPAYYVGRYQLVNIFATVSIGGWDWHLVGPGRWVNQKNLSIVYPTPPAQFGGHWVAVNLYEQNMVAYDGGTPVMATLISSGVKNGLWNTPEGTFNVHSRVEKGTMNGSEGNPDYYSLDMVPYAQYFTGLYSLHGTYWHNSFGYPHSHGCVNLTVSDAKWLFGFIGDGATVHVYNGKY